MITLTISDWPAIMQIQVFLDIFATLVLMQYTIGFIGQGFVGKNTADDFEHRGYTVIRYALEEPYRSNKDLIKNCQIVFIAVPTPTTAKQGFDSSLVRNALSLLADNTLAIIKSTILPGTTEALQAEFPALYVMHSPEFLRESSAAEDTAHPQRNIIGIATDTAEHRQRAEVVMSLLPTAAYAIITTARNAECIKYIGNAFLYAKLVFMNIAHDFVKSSQADWETVRDAVGHDSRIGPSHTEVVYDSGRGAGGHCFIKDFEALVQYYEQHASDSIGLNALTALRSKNHQLLMGTHKDIDLLQQVYGNAIPLD